MVLLCQWVASNPPPTPCPATWKGCRILVVLFSLLLPSCSDYRNKMEPSGLDGGEDWYKKKKIKFSKQKGTWLLTGNSQRWWRKGRMMSLLQGHKTNLGCFPSGQAQNTLKVSAFLRRQLPPQHPRALSWAKAVGGRSGGSSSPGGLAACLSWCWALLCHKP